MAHEGPVRVAVVGAGIAGLTVAWELRARGFEVEVFEQNANLGGKLGANPMRLPLAKLAAADCRDPIDGLTPIGQRAPAAPADLPSRVMRDQSLSDADMANLRESLDDVGSDVPGWIDRAIRRWLHARQDRLSRKRHQGGDRAAGTSAPSPRSARSFKSQGRVTPSEGEPEWRIVDPDDKSEFRVALHKRFDETWTVDINDGLRHEHCYHMYLNWYVNFWRLMKEIGLDRSTHFEPRDHYLHMSPGSAPVKRRTQTLKKLGKTEQWAANMLSGITTVPDSFLVLYSALDLVSAPLDPERYLDHVSVHGFLSSRWYASEESIKQHEHLLLRAFAVPAYYSSAYAYQKHLAFTLADPDPALWVLKSNVDGTLFGTLAAKLGQPDRKSEGSCTIHHGLRVTRLGFDAQTGLANSLVFRPSDTRWPRNNSDGERQDDTAGPEQEAEFRPHYVVLAIPPRALAEVVSDFRDRVPGMAAVRKLQSGVTAVLDLHFTRKLEDIPPHHVVLRNSRYAISFFDNAQLWHRVKSPGGGVEVPDPDAPTQLSVAVTDFYRIEGMTKEAATREIIADLQRFIPFDAGNDINYSRTYLQMNVNEPLFLNEVGSEPWRPETVTEIPNVFLAGDFVANDIDVVCVEGAVLSGLNAARAVQAQLRADQPELAPAASYFDEIKVRMPKTLPRANAEAMKAMLAPYLPAAKAASSALETRQHPERALSPRDLRAGFDGMLTIPGEAAASAAGLQAGVAQWLADLPVQRRGDQ